MPYHLEKGATLRLLEQHLNASRKQRRALLDTIRASPPGDVGWLGQGLPSLWADTRFERSPQKTGTAVLDDVKRRWFGYEEQGGRWQPVPGRPTTGYWIAYQGEVAEIMRRAFQWALELSFGLEPGEEGPGRVDPWPIEAFWKCPAPWFEAWVLERPIGGAGLVSIVLVTPSHERSNVSESPIATSPVSMVPGASHPVPSHEDDYEVLGRPHPTNPNRPRVPAADRRWSTWIVTHENHRTGGQVNVTSNTVMADFSDWGIPRLRIYEGVGDVVVVSPSMAAGGVKQDGTV